MPITYVFGIGASWQSVMGQLLASGMALLCGHQDLGLRPRVSSVFFFFMAIATGISALITAIGANLSFAPAICVVVLFCETCMILRWMLRSRSSSSR